MTSRGYLTIATGSEEYFTQAANLAKSIAAFDRGAAICLLHDRTEAEAKELAPGFSDYLRFGDADMRRTGVEFKVLVDVYSPYERTMFVDADMLMANPGIEDIWNIVSARGPVCFAGERITSGFWRVDIEGLRKRFGVDHVVRHNAGCFCFDRSEASTAFFVRCREMLENHPDAFVQHSRGRGISVEPIFAVAMALEGAYVHPGGEWHLSTLNVTRWTMSGDVVSISRRNGPLVAPKFLHFVGLGKNHCPNDLYASMLNRLAGSDMVVSDVRPANITKEAIGDLARSELVEFFRPLLRPFRAPNPTPLIVDFLFTRLDRWVSDRVFALQVGANDGQSSDLLTKFISRGKWRGILIEPNPVALKQLRERHAGNSDICIEGIAVSANLSELTMYYPASGDTKKTSSDPGLAAKTSRSTDLLEFTVPAESLDSIIARHQVDAIDILAIDAEGADFDVLQSIDLDRNRPLVIIFETCHMDEETLAACREKMARHKYHPIQLDADAIALREDVFRDLSLPLINHLAAHYSDLYRKQRYGKHSPFR